jgi:hypothetical protein
MAHWYLTPIAAGDKLLIVCCQNRRLSKSVASTPDPYSSQAFPASPSEPAPQTRNLYQYQPLHQEREIRLLKINLGATYEIIHTTIENAPPFEPISYVWGVGICEYTLVLSNEEVVMINKNLRKALPSLSSRCSFGYLWIDQICINQGSITERNQQVKIMGDIYKAGRKV